MDFYFIDTSNKELSVRGKFLKRFAGLTKKIFRHDLVLMPLDHEMLTIEQTVNIYHFINQLIACDVKGDVIECGVFTGSSALQIEYILEKSNANRAFHLYDRFDEAFYHDKQNTLDILKNNFFRAGLRLPAIHKGLFSETIPSMLPEIISFAHIDCGFGGSPEEHKKLILHLLESFYPRMPKGAIGLLMDYHEPSKTFKGLNSNPGVKLACDEFFNDKMEEVYCLYGGYFSHGYFRKK